MTQRRAAGPQGRPTGKYDKAEPLFLRAIAIFEAKLGLEHPNTRAAKENYDRLQRR